MEILDQIEGRITKAVQTIEALQARVLELEGQKSDYEEKLSALLSHLDQFAEPAEAAETEEPAPENHENQHHNEQNNAEHHHF